MAKNKTFLENLKSYAWEYIDECENKRKEQLTNKGSIAHIAERKMPVIDYFLFYWIPKNYSKRATIHRGTYYRWLRWENTIKKKAIEEIDAMFKAVQMDVVANEGKGLAYIKHKYGWADKQQTELNANVNQYTANFGTVIPTSQQSSEDTPLD